MPRLSAKLDIHAGRETFFLTAFVSVRLRYLIVSAWMIVRISSDEWAMAEGIIYDMFEKEKHVRNIQAIRPKLIDGNRYVSCDYGTQNATVFLLWNKGVDGAWYCIREYYYSGRDHGKQKTDSEYADDLDQCS